MPVTIVYGQGAWSAYVIELLYINKRMERSDKPLNFLT